MTMRGKIVLLTGATGGIGQAIARRLSHQGAILILVGRSAPTLNALARELDLQKNKGFTLVAAVADGTYTSFNYAFPERCALILGSEGQGIEAELLAQADVRLAIPIRMGVDSLNVSTAAAMLVHEYVRQQEARS